MARRLRAALLVAPLIILLMVSFCLPIAALLTRAVYDPTIADALPRTAAALSALPGHGVPDDVVFAAFGADLLADKPDNTVFLVAKTLNDLLPEARSHVCCSAARRLAPGDVLTREAMIAADPFWGDDNTWFIVRGAVRPFTASYLLPAAIDMKSAAKRRASARYRRTRRYFKQYSWRHLHGQVLAIVSRWQPWYSAFRSPGCLPICPVHLRHWLIMLVLLLVLD